MAINFNEIPNKIEVPLEPLQKTKTVSEELNARQYLLNERSIKCANIKPFYAQTVKPQHRYTYKYLCVCPRYNPKYVCKHTDNIIVDRDVLTQEEHTVYLATPKPNFAATRKMPRYILKKTIMANCTPRIVQLAKPDRKQVATTLNDFSEILTKRQQNLLKKMLEKTAGVEYTSIKDAVDLLREEKRLRKVAERKQKVCCEKLRRRIGRKQRRQIKKIMCLLFEQMKEFLLNDQFIMDESATLGTVILQAIREFTDNEFNITNDLREYQKTLAFNLAAWINKFIANLNVNMNENAAQCAQQMPQTEGEQPTQELLTFLPVDDYISNITDAEQVYQEEEEEEEYENDGNSSYHPRTTSEKTLENIE